MLRSLPLLSTPRLLRWVTLASMLVGCPDPSGGGGDADCPAAGRLCTCDRGTGRTACLGDATICECPGRDVEVDGNEVECVPTGDELCNGRDDDCDGRVDELSGVCRQVDTCFAGRRVCADRQPANGMAVDCRDVTGVDRPESGEERCSGVDDDCDGRVDEGFDTQVDPQHCGACGRDCTAPFGVSLEGASFACEAGSCRVEACGSGREDRDGDPRNGCECAPGALDRPDPLRVDADCDDRVDEDVEIQGAVFVDGAAPAGGDGGPDSPFDDLRAAVAAAEREGKWQLVIAAGRHDLHPGVDEEDPVRRVGLAVPDGLWIRGGFLRDEAGWYRSSRGLERTAIVGASPALHFEGLTRPTALESVDVSAARGVDGRSTDDGPVSGSGSVAILATEVGEHLLIADARIESEDAGRGHRGAPGEPGRAGGDGGRPGEPESLADCAAPETPLRCGGQRGITRRCEPAVTVPVGGDGGDAERSGSAGEAGAGRVPASGGASGRDGAAGTPGEQGRAGELGGRMGRLTDDGVWVPDVGRDGLAGRPGNGGGGGGGARIYGGGGGGGGGCPGLAGTAAEGGQGSFGIVVRGGRVRLVDAPDGDLPGRLMVRARRGGPGGTAGRGGVGGAGGRGALGEPVEGACPGCTAGGAGGSGGRGGCGGHGGPGAGGPSFAILRVPPAGGDINRSRVEFLRPVGDPADPERRAAVDDPAAAMAAYLDVLGGGDGGRAGEGADCPATTEDGPVGLAGAVGCCVVDEAGRCAPLGPCAP